MSWFLRPSEDRAEWVSWKVSCPACGSSVTPLSVGNTTGITAWLPVKCAKESCRREWAIRAQLVPVSEQIAQAQYA
jgi:hypothetical protein